VDVCLCLWDGNYLVSGMNLIVLYSAFSLFQATFPSVFRRTLG
jgi:hypothetical protein